MKLYQVRNAGIGALALALGACQTTGGTTPDKNPLPMVSGTTDSTFAFKYDVYTHPNTRTIILENQLVRPGHNNCDFDKYGWKKVPEGTEKQTIVSKLQEGYEWRDVRDPKNSRSIVGSILVKQASGSSTYQDAIVRYRADGKCEILVRDTEVYHPDKSRGNHGKRKDKDTPRENQKSTPGFTPKQTPNIGRNGTINP